MMVQKLQYSVGKLAIHGWQHGNSVSTTRQYMVDNLAIQESSGMHLSKLVKLLSPVHSVVKWGGCSILSSLPMEEVEVRPREMVAGLPGRRSYHPRFITARVQVQADRQGLCCT